MTVPTSRKDALIAQSEQQRSRLLESAVALRSDLQAYNQRSQDYALVALVAVGLSFGIWLALRTESR
jgi:hypothetical protein